MIWFDFENIKIWLASSVLLSLICGELVHEIVIHHICQRWTDCWNRFKETWDLLRLALIWDSFFVLTFRHRSLYQLGLRDFELQEVRLWLRIAIELLRIETNILLLEQGLRWVCLVRCLLTSATHCVCEVCIKPFRAEKKGWTWV